MREYWGVSFCWSTLFWLIKKYACIICQSKLLTAVTWEPNAWTTSILTTIHCPWVAWLRRWGTKCKLALRDMIDDRTASVCLLGDTMWELIENHMNWSINIRHCAYTSLINACSLRIKDPTFIRRVPLPITSTAKRWLLALVLRARGLIWRSIWMSFCRAILTSWWNMALERYATPYLTRSIYLLR